MNLLKFTFGQALGYFAGALLIAFVSLYIFYCNQQKQETKKYEEKYDQLVFLVENSIVNAPTKKAIKEKFEEISMFNCLNSEKLHVLRQNFNIKFKDIK